MKSLKLKIKDLLIPKSRSKIFISAWSISLNGQASFAPSIPLQTDFAASKSFVPVVACVEKQLKSSPVAGNLMVSVGHGSENTFYQF